MPARPTDHGRRELLKAAVLFGLIPVALLGGSTWTYLTGDITPLLAAVAYVLGGGTMGVVSLIRGLDDRRALPLPPARLLR